VQSGSVRAVLLCGLILNAVDARAAEFTSVAVGYQQQAQVGRWMPVRITADDLSPGQIVALSMTSVDARGNRVIQFCGSDSADSFGHIALNGFGRTGRLDMPIQIELVDQQNSDRLCSTSIRCSEEPIQDGAVAIQTSLRIYRHDVQFLLTVARPAGIEELLNQAMNASPNSPALAGVSVDSADQLSADSRAYDPFAAMLLTGDEQLNDDQFHAVRLWVRSGGHLIVSCADEISDLLPTPVGQYLHDLFDLLPDTRIVTDTDLGALQQIVPRATRISTLRRRVRMAQLRSDQPVLLAESGSGPLVARSASGGGIVTFVAVDLNARPISQWNSLSDFYAVLLLGAPLSKSEGRSGSSRISSSGVSDLATQLMTIVDPVPQSGRWTTWSVMALTFGWLILIGPVDYLIVVMLLKRPHLTWVTFPLWVIIGCAGLYSLKSGDSAIVLNSVHLVDVTGDGHHHTLQTRSLLSVSAPLTVRAELEASVDTALAGQDPELTLSWSGRPEDVYGGMYRATGIGGNQLTYEHDVAHADTLTSVPLLIDGSFETQAHWISDFESPLVTSDLNVSGFGLLGGSFTHHLPAPIHDWAVVFGNRIYRPRDDLRESLPGGQPWAFRPGGSQISDLKSWLAGSRPMREPPVRIASAQSSVQRAYSALGRDPLDIVTVMSLYQTVGAHGYTGLNSHTFRRMDVSDSIRLNQALVIGWMDSPATQLAVNGTAIPETSSTTIVRLMVPVNRRPALPKASIDGEPDGTSNDERDTPRRPGPSNQKVNP